MDFASDSEQSMFSLGDESDGYVPQKKGKPASRPAAKKMVQTTFNSKKRPNSDSDGGESLGETSGFSNTPPSAKKQKMAPAAKKPTSSKPLAEVSNASKAIDGPSHVQTNKTATETYQKLTQLEHIIKRPDTYIGSVEKTEQQMWVFNKETSQMEYRTITYVPGFYKIFDEILVNAADNRQRDKSMTHMKVNIDRESGEVSVENNGKGIPVVIHEKENIYIPELIFGHLLAGSNFDDNEQKTVGGRNGYGAKLCNVFSTQFTLECQDSQHGKRYKQTWSDNMQRKDKAKITANKSTDFVRVTFKPDYERFGMPEGITDDLEALLFRRVYDMAGTVDGVKVYLNGTMIKLKDFKSYCDLYAKSIASERSAEEGGSATCTVEIDRDKSHPRWQVAFTVSDGTFQQVSFVNSIATTSGGTHVNYIADQVTASLLKTLNKKQKGHSLKQSHLRNHIFIFVNCLVNNPAFTSQTKEQLTTKVSQFGSQCRLGEDFLKKIAKSDAIQNILEFAQKKADKMMSKSDGNKRSRVSNAKLVEANLAGTRHGHECTLILTEGDSAKGLAVSGRAILDPDRIGVFPLRGKLLNVRDASLDQIAKNQEIQNIKQFLGLKHKQVYTDTKSLRYGHLMIMADQDHDGSHIKGLLINFLQVQFPSLLKLPDFFREFITPIVKIWQGPNPKKPHNLMSFFTQPQYEAWKESHKSELSRWHSKYFKGLGTSSNEDAQVYFTNLDDHLKEFQVMKPEEAELFELAFSKKKADARKEWLGNFVPGTFLDHSTKSITYGDFVNKELILFSMADNIRSIPSVVDGFKPGQRKVLYACFKRNLIKDKKVVELAGYVSEQTAYHHGEMSLQQTIIGLAQNFVGSNNLNCLEPSGNFGSRLAGGSDAASPRYIFTRLSPFARKIFSALDEPNLVSQIEDGKPIEPTTYAPIIPMILVNGAEGIGTGWSTSIPNYHPSDIVKNLKRRMGRLDGKNHEEVPFEPMMPWFRGWKGTPDAAGPDRYKFNGVATQNEKNPNEVIITELPIKMWTDDFKAKLEKVISGVDGPSWIKDYKEFNDHKTVHFEIMVDEKHMDKVLSEGILERFKLTKQVATSNLVAFDTRGQIRKYEKVEQIMEEYYQYRIAMYTKRKKHWLAVYHADYRKLTNQARFIQEIIDGVLVVNKKKKLVLVQELRDRDYEAFPPGQTVKEKEEDESETAEGDDPDDADGGSARDFDYLLSMPIWSFTLERLEKLKAAIVNKKLEHDNLLAKSEKDLWCTDLDELMVEWENQMAIDSEIQTKIRRMGRRVSKKIGAGRGRKANDDDDFKPKARGRPKAATKSQTKTAQRLATKLKGGAEDLDDMLSEDDFAALGQDKSASWKGNQQRSYSQSFRPGEERTKRVAASRAQEMFEVLSDSGDDKMLDDVHSAMVKGIGKPEVESSNRLGLHAMNRTESNHGGLSSSSGLSKLKKKASKLTLDIDSMDDTNYELLAKPLPRKTVSKDDVDEFLSDDDEVVMQPKGLAAKTKSDKVEGLAAVKKVRGRGATSGSTATKGTKATAPASKAVSSLSPAAKAYAAKKKVHKSSRAPAWGSDDDVLADGPSVAPKPAARTRPGRAAAARRPIVVDDDSTVLDFEQDDEDSDVFEMDDDE
ncbi:hypothetical protein CDD82_4418 [Ophiocordyceps australis]|uniref:DNA topoisomerase 2 n=1 Tax=Ophiocordyceps australis TaxID=1399860 RepID=A0A2C5ZSU4_9HYPO|nr:hypothetical protein CDD82_4418 [Ophiocordyceps australis]